MASDKLLLLITGANQGLGFHAVQQLSATNKFHILMGARDLKKAEQAIAKLADDNYVQAIPSNVEPITIDMSSDGSIEAAAKEVEQKYGRLDVLMLNAGIGQAKGNVRREFEQIYDTNVFGAAVTVDAFLPLLRKSSAVGGKRIAFTSSDLSSLQIALKENGLYSGANFAVYRSSKTAINMMMVHYTKLLEGEGFVVTATNPGFSNTAFNGNSGPKDPRDGAKVIASGVTEAKEKCHGRLIDENGPMPW